MNKMHNINSSSMDEYVELRLIEWAEWHRRDNDGGIGYPKTSSIRMFLEGSVLKKKKRKTSTPLPSHEAAEEIERFICEMNEQNKIMASAVKLHYLDHLSMRTNANRLKLSHTHFKLFLRMGKQWLAGRLSYNHFNY